MVIGMQLLLLEVSLQAVGADEQQRAHGKIVANRSQLVIDEGTCLALAVGREGVMVGIEQ